MEQVIDHAANGHGPDPMLIKDMLVFLIAAGVLVPALRVFKIPVVIGFMLAGLALGPFALGRLADDFPLLTFISITEPAAAQPFAELGVLFLLFLLGVEFSFERLWGLRRVVFGAGGLQSGLSAAVIGLTAYLFGLEPGPAIVVGLAFALSSTAIVMQGMVEQRQATKPVGRATLGVLLFQDIMVAPILIFVGFVTIRTEANLSGVLLDALVRGVIAIGVIYAIGRYALGHVFRLAAASGGRDFLMALTLLTVVGAAAITATAGLSLALGAFLAGLLVGETEFKHQTEVDLEPFKGLLLGLFFMTVGMGLDLQAIGQNAGGIFLALVGLIAAKFVIAFAACRLFAGPRPLAIEAAMWLAPAGEFAFVILAAARSGGAVDAGTSNFLGAVAGLSMLATPLLGKLGKRLAKKMAAGKVPAFEQDDVSVLEGHIILAGYGRVGQSIARMLQEEEAAIVALDRDPAKVLAARQNGLKAFVGDAARAEILELTGIEGAELFIVTVDDAAGAEAMVRTVRSLRPDIPILARAHDHEHAALLEAAGATQVIPEAIESGLQMVGWALEAFGYNTETVRDRLAVARDDEYRRA